MSGDYSEGVPPVLIPNTAVKPFSATYTSRAGDWETRTLPDSIGRDSLIYLFFFLFLKVGLNNLRITCDVFAIILPSI